MKRTILRYGFIGGFIVAAELIATTVYTKARGTSLNMAWSSVMHP